jgi:hypothetical protein
MEISILYNYQKDSRIKDGYSKSLDFAPHKRYIWKLPTQFLLHLLSVSRANLRRKNEKDFSAQQQKKKEYPRFPGKNEHAGRA